MQADLNTYQTSSLQFPGDIKSESLPPSSNEASSSSSESQHLSTGIPLLRRTLYGLKDALSELHVSIQNWLTERVVTYTNITRLRSLQTSVSLTINALSTCLTNHGSDWLDSLLAGGMSFSQFRALDHERLWTVGEMLGQWTQLVSSRYSFARPWEVVGTEFELTENDLALPKGLLEELNHSLKAQSCS